MKVSKIMTADPITCTPSTNLAEAAALMMKGDCGILPVVDDGKLCGVVTDRDLFIAAGTRDRKPSTIKVSEVMKGPLFSCGPDDDLEAVLSTMKHHAIRRLPVLGFAGTVIGIVSMNDVIVGIAERQAVPAPMVIDTLEAICAHHHPEPRIAVA